MNVHARRRKARIGFAYIVEVLADVLQEAKDNGEGGLTAMDVHRRTGLSGTDLGIDPGYHVCVAVLNDMARDGVAVNDKPGLGPGKWRLAE